MYPTGLQGAVRSRQVHQFKQIQCFSNKKVLCTAVFGLTRLITIFFY